MDHKKELLWSLWVCNAKPTAPGIVGRPLAFSSLLFQLLFLDWAVVAAAVVAAVACSS